MLKHRATVEAYAAHAKHRELDRQRIALFAVRLISRRTVYGPDRTVGKSASVERRGFFGIVFVPEADETFVYGMGHDRAPLFALECTTLQQQASF